MEGGGLLSAIDENLDPALITENDQVELLTIQLTIGNLKVRSINAYGPQEDDDTEIKLDFWHTLEKEVIEAKDQDCLVIIQLDANAKVGCEVINGDVNPISGNGKLLLDMVMRQNLHIGNALEVCEGLITRERNTVWGIERSVIDYVILCDKFRDYLKSLLIDDDRNHVLTKFSLKSGVVSKVKSDHNVIICTFTIKYNIKKKSVRKEVFQFKDQNGKEAFFQETSKQGSFSDIFLSCNEFSHQANIFYKKLRGCMHKCFKKIRIVKGGRKNRNMMTYNQVLMRKKQEYEYILKNCSCSSAKEELQHDLDLIEKKLAENISREKSNSVRDHLNSLKINGTFSQLRLWKVRQKVCPRPADPPMAKKDTNGNLVTAPKQLKKLYSDTYKHRLRNRVMKEDLIDIYFLKKDLWASRLIELEKNKTDGWNLQELRLSLKSLKTNKTTDPNDMINELFKDGCLGNDLEQALLLLFNGIKNTGVIPEYLLKQNISSIYKNKGSRLELKNDRGIFILTTLKKILDKLIYHEKQKDIDNHMSGGTNRLKITCLSYTVS